MHNLNQPLGYWLAYRQPDYPGLAESNTALRSMAFNYGQKRGMVAALLGLAATLVGFGLYAAVVAQHLHLLWLWMGLLSAPMIIASSIVIAQMNEEPVPKIQTMAPSRGPGDIKSGASFGAFMYAIMGAIFYPVLSPLTDYGLSGVFGFAVGYILLLSFVFSVFVLPSIYISNARKDFRKLIIRDRRVSDELEYRSLTWSDPVGTMPFGPL